MKYFWLLLVAACATTVVPPIFEKPEPFVTGFPKQEWTDYTLDLVKKSRLVQVTAKDEKEFCPQGMNAYNWTSLISAMAYAESGYKPESEYRESFKNGKGEWVISTGLLQISLESGNAYGCGFKSQSDLKDPYKNLACGVKILERWVERDGQVAGYRDGNWRGGSRYWSVMRTSSKSFEGKVKARLKPLCR